MTLDEMRAALGREDEIAFTPVPRLRQRRNGWSDAAQRDFIAALSLTGSVRAATEVVGLSPRSAYRLAAPPRRGPTISPAPGTRRLTAASPTAKRASGSPRVYTAAAADSGADVVSTLSTSSVSTTVKTGEDSR